MSRLDLLLIAIGLSMDAFAVSICKGLALRKISWKSCAICGLWFGGFQALMPLLGYLVGYNFQSLVTGFDHWIAFILLTLIGGNMLREAFGHDEEEEVDASLGFKTMLLLAIATSIDALAVGVNFAFLPDTNIALAVSFIGVTTCVISMLGVKVGSVFGVRYKSKAEIAGGAILIFLGLKILLEHLGVF